MKNFFKYFLHFWGIVSFLAIILLMFVRPSLPIKQTILSYLIIIVGFVFPMSLFFSFQTKTVTRTINGDTIELYERLDSELRTKYHRTCTDMDEDCKKVYVYTLRESSPFAGVPFIARYLQWLTNNIVITRDGLSLTIEGPRTVVNKLDVK